MAKLAQNFAKYVIQARMTASGTVEKPDIIGAIFGQTEGLLGQDLDLRELQKTGRIGRIEVNVRNVKGNVIAEILIPSSLDSSETALIAAALETIEKVGPCDAKVEVDKVEDVRTQKRRFVVDRAKFILQGMVGDIPESQNLAEHIRQAVRSYEINSWQGLSCGSELLASDEIIIVEGRADVINLVKNGIRNCVAMEGSKVAEPIVQLAKEKVVTALLDGDRGGELNLKKLLMVADIDFVAQADEGLEVEELSKKQLFKSLRDRAPVSKILEELGGHEALKKELAAVQTAETEPAALDSAVRQRLLKYAEQLIGTRASFLLDSDARILSKLPVGELSLLIQDYPEAKMLVIDSKINQDLADLAIQWRLKCVVGTGLRDEVKAPKELVIMTPEELKAAA